MEVLTNQIKQLANLEHSGKCFIRPCLIENYDPKTYRVQVTIHPDDIFTGWVPMASWGEIAPPTPGKTQALIVFFGGDVNSGIVVGKIFSKLDPPPQDVDVTAPGSFLFKTIGGTEVKVTNDGEVVISNNTKISVGDKTEDFKRLVKETVKDLYNAHTHTPSGPPPEPAYLITDSDLTTVLEGN